MLKVNAKEALQKIKSEDSTRRIQGVLKKDFMEGQYYFILQKYAQERGKDYNSYSYYIDDSVNYFAYIGELLERHKSIGLSVEDVLLFFYSRVNQDDPIVWEENTTQWENFVKKFEEIKTDIFKTESDVWLLNLLMLHVCYIKYTFATTPLRDSKGDKLADYIVQLTEELLSGLDAMDENFLKLLSLNSKYPRIISDYDISKIYAEFIKTHKIDIENFNYDFDDFELALKTDIKLFRSIVKTLKLKKQYFKDNLDIFNDLKKMNKLGKTSKEDELPFKIFVSRELTALMNILLVIPAFNIKSYDKYRLSHQRQDDLNSIFDLYSRIMSQSENVKLKEYLKFVGVWSNDICYEEHKVSLTKFFNFKNFDVKVEILDEEECVDSVLDCLVNIQKSYSYSSEQKIYISSLMHLINECKNNDYVESKLKEYIQKYDTFSHSKYRLLLSIAIERYDLLSNDFKTFLSADLAKQEFNGIENSEKFCNSDVFNKIKHLSDIRLYDLKYGSKYYESLLAIQLIISDLLFRDKTFNDENIKKIIKMTEYPEFAVSLSIQKLDNFVFETDLLEYFLEKYSLRIEKDLCKKIQYDRASWRDDSKIEVHQTFLMLAHKYPELVEKFVEKDFKNIEQVLFGLGMYGTLLLSIYNCPKLRQIIGIEESDYVCLAYNYRDEVCGNIKENISCTYFNFCKGNNLINEKQRDRMVEEIFKEIEETNNLREMMASKVILGKIKNDKKYQTFLSVYDDICDISDSQLKSDLLKAYLSAMKTYQKDCKYTSESPYVKVVLELFDKNKVSKKDALDYLEAIL